jgi:hypothetical protein
MTATPTSVSIDKASFHNDKIYINKLFEYEVPKDIQRKAGKILTDWFKKARLSLRVQGGDVNHPFIKSTAVLANKRRYAHYGSEARMLLTLKPADFKHEGGGRICPLRDIILENKIDLKSISIVMWRIQYGDDKLPNVVNRFRTEYRPLMMHLLLNTAKLEDS